MTKMKTSPRTPPMKSGLPPVKRALAEIREKASELRDNFGDEGRARSLEWAHRIVEAALVEAASELVSLEEAAVISGYCDEHLRRLVRQGTLPDHRKPGSRGRMYLRRSELPIKPRTAGTQYDPVADAQELLAKKLFGPRKGRGRP
jgi:hypothetical protein